ncbi:MAG: YabP/YqfC family sporulation protein [Clostridiales bacterium]|nr:YabP/YqfC family sporulation protein [Clostridiales bacterium]
MGRKKKKGGGFRGTLAAAAEKIDIPVSAIVKTSRISMDGNRQMVLEGHEGILEYETNIVRINCMDMIVTVEGTDLLVKAMNPDGLSLSGIIKKIEFSD